MLRRQPRFTLTDKLFPHTSLFRYPVEGRFDVAPPAVVVEPPGPLPTDLAGRLARWDADATQAQQDFTAERNLTAPLVSAATGSAMSRERWVVAHQATARLIAARTTMTGALADIGRRYIERRVVAERHGPPRRLGIGQAQKKHEGGRRRRA